ncbi:MAG TPA: class I SAM-dependent methyltransferase [Vicinamibacterales bacterium]|jgi:SAM-dependent methyltransferase|nr:class I SAM-dependent methyltransferase [Vicinamibacterales bacterium]
MSDRWTDYIRGGIDQAGGPVPFALSQWSFLAPITAAIARHCPVRGRLLDVGCGAGIYPSLLAHFGYQVAGIDEEPRIVALAREMADYFRAPAAFEQGSAFDLGPSHGKFDLVYSLGVVEHFDADVTVTLIQEQARCAPVVLIVIPTRHTRFAAPPTDERFYSRRQFEGLVAKTGLRIRESFVFGDLPTPAAVAAARLLPKVINRPVRYLLTYGMGLCCVAARD